MEMPKERIGKGKKKIFWILTKSPETIYNVFAVFFFSRTFPKVLVSVCQSVDPSVIPNKEMEIAWETLMEVSL